MSSTPNPQAHELPRQRRLWGDALELVSSMRFAIALLTVICIASVIGTVVKQNEPLNNYVNQFGPFWMQVFGTVNLYTVYSAPWFLLILAFLVLSTSLCIARNTPKILADLRQYKEHLREQSLLAFHHRGQATLSAQTPEQTLARVSDLLSRRGWRAKVQTRPDGTLIAARRGAANKLGYIAAHSSIVLICLGGLFDGDLVVKAMMWAQGKSTYSGLGSMAAVPAEHRLGAHNPTFRGNLLVPEGFRAGTAVINLPKGVVLQDLPFDVELKKFRVDYYETGMPKLFSSDIVIHDKQTGAQVPAVVKVNEPASYKGVMIYQSSFDDGGSRVKLRALPTGAQSGEFPVEGVIGQALPIQSNGGDGLTLELTALRVINVENLGSDSVAGADVRRVDLRATLDQHLGSGAKGNPDRHLRNVGPSIGYKLRDAAGQAREFHNYMLPVELDGQRVFLAGVRDNPNEAFRYLRLPADAHGGLESYSRLRHALLDPAQRKTAIARYVALATPASRPEMKSQLIASAERTLDLFAGAAPAAPGETATGGLTALSVFLERNVPADQRERVSEVLLRILNGCLRELYLISQTGEASAQEPSSEFMAQALIALSDNFTYPAPLLFQLSEFEHIQASVFQVAKAPGKTLVYLGAVLLIIGIFAMLYVRDRRLWVWIAPPREPQAQGSRVVMAMSSTRQTMDADAEFDQLRQDILGGAAGATETATACANASAAAPASQETS